MRFRVASLAVHVLFGELRVRGNYLVNEGNPRGPISTICERESGMRSTR